LSWEDALHYRYGILTYAECLSLEDRERWSFVEILGEDQAYQWLCAQIDPQDIDLVDLQWLRQGLARRLEREHYALDPFAMDRVTQRVWDTFLEQSAAAQRSES
jgi:hypothetical protein